MGTIKKKKPEFTLLLSVVGFLIFSSFILFVVPEFVKQRLEVSWNIQNGENNTNVGQIGDVFGGTTAPFIGLFAAILTFAAFYIQYKANQDVREQFNLQQFESQFYEMIRIHKSNVEELKYKYRTNKKIDNSGEIYFEHQIDEKRKVFKAIYSQYKELFAELSHLFTLPITDIYEEHYLKLLNKNNELKIRKIDLIELSKIDFTYLIVYFGLGSEDRIVLKDLLIGKYRNDFVDKILNFSAKKPEKFSDNWEDWNKWYPLDLSFRDYNPVNKFNKYYGGHQHRLSHYFRNLFQIVQIIDRNEELTYDRKYSYAKLLRAQLSNYEQIIFCINSLSQCGRAWEIENRKTNSSAYKINRQYITKFNLIKNIPSNNLIPGIALNSYYPNVDYDTFTAVESKLRIELETQFS